MRKGNLLLVLAICLILVQCEKTHGWGITYTHPALTQYGVDGSQLDAYCEKLLIDEVLKWDFNDWDPAITARMMEAGEPLNIDKTVSEWIRAGCKIEDTRLKIEGRSSNHFHDPLRDTGLYNWEFRSLYAEIAGHLIARETYLGKANFDLSGYPAWLWVRAFYPGKNYHSWEIGRACLHVGLIAADPSDREEYLAAAFMSLGHTLHMIEDMGVPPHARNDFLTAHIQHVEWADTVAESFGNRFEYWVEGQIAASSEAVESEEGSEGTLVLPEDEEPGGNDWVESGSEAIYFPRLSDYWDAEEYTASNYDSFSGGPSSDSWGLAERTNYQFLSNTTIFLQDPKGLNGSRYYFPHPARVNVAQLPSGPGDYLTGYGITHLVRRKYISNPPGLPVTWETTFDECVYEDYANVTIPRTIRYARGLVNYFCRGELEVGFMACDSLEKKIYIKNLSRFNTGSSYINQILRGGHFWIYWDNADGYRRPLDGYPYGECLRIWDDCSQTEAWGEDSGLAYGDSTCATFYEVTPPGEEIVSRYVLVYSGNIISSEIDPDDTMAVAVAEFYNSNNACQTCDCDHRGLWPICETPNYVTVELDFSGYVTCCIGADTPPSGSFTLLRGDASGMTLGLCEYGCETGVWQIIWSADPGYLGEADCQCEEPPCPDGSTLVVKGPPAEGHFIYFKGCSSSTCGTAFINNITCPSPATGAVSGGTATIHIPSDPCPE